jgi:beta-aspartyl-peptidase (threonine type)
MTNPQERQPMQSFHLSPTGGPALVIHGGAGAWSSELSLEASGSYQSGLADAVAAGADVLGRGGTALDAVTAAVVSLEDNPLFNAGRGASLTTAGTAEHDAAVMDHEGRAGAIAVSRCARNPVLVARAVMQRTPHAFIVGPSADAVRGWGLETAEPDYFVTPARQRQLEDVLAARTEASRSGTVGAVAVDGRGRVAAAASTGGMVGQSEVRVGDSPVIGAGTYARGDSAAISCTGEGEAYLQGVVAHDIVSRMRYAGSSLEQAVTATYDVELESRSATGGTIAVTPAGEVLIAHNSPAMFAGYWNPAGTRVFA